MDNNSQLKPKRKTLDERIGIIGMATIAVIGMFIFPPIANICGLSAIYYLLKGRKDNNIPKKVKVIGWILVSVWLVIIGFLYGG